MQYGQKAKSYYTMNKANIAMAKLLVYGPKNIGNTNLAQKRCTQYSSKIQCIQRVQYSAQRMPAKQIQNICRKNYDSDYRPGNTQD